MTTHARPIGILGGGQLSRMLAQAGARIGLDMLVLAGRADEPAAQVAPHHVGTWDDPTALRQFLASTSVVCFESEFAPCELLNQAAQGLDVDFRPSLGALFILQDKLRQKALCHRLGIAAAPWVELSEAQEVEEILKTAHSRFPQGWVLKWARLGYDGYGTLISGTPQPERERAFVAAARAKRVPLFVEERIAFRRELALVAVRSRTGEWDAYPLVVSQQEGGICHLVQGPARAVGVSAELETQARDSARQLGEALDLCGAYALEFFETTEGRLLLNEIAPRVHNSGHYTLDAADTSQFENHLRGILGMGLGSTATAPVFAMRNLLGPAQTRVEALPEATGDVALHWYGKAEFRPGRKLGHLNIRGKDPAELPTMLRKLEEVDRDWQNRTHG